MLIGFASVAVTPVDMARSRIVPPPSWLPLMVTPMLGPWIVTDSVALLSVRVAESVIVRGTAKNVGSKEMIAGLVSASALATAD